MRKIFADLPTGSQWVLSVTDIGNIASAYGLSSFRVEAGPRGGAVNGIARVRCAEGEWIFRVHRPWTTPARLAGIHAVQEALRADGHPIPRVLQTTRHATFAILADRLVEVVEYVPSDSPADDWARTARACATLGELQSSFARLAPESLPQPSYSSYATPETALAMLRETDDAFLALSASSGYRQAALAREQTRALLEALAAARYSYESALSMGYVHGDYGGDNVLLSSGEVVAILDFDFMAYRERIFDPAYTLYWALHRFCRRKSDTAISPRCISAMGGLLQHYRRQAAIPLNAHEVAALPLEMARIPLFWLAEAGYLSESGADDTTLKQIQRFADHIATARQLIDNAVQIGQLFRQALE